MRIALGIEYDGSAFHGWQTQQGVRTVQAALELALSGVADHPVGVYCAGRTDAGVHASGQVVHFDTSAVRSDRAWVLGANVNLPFDVNVVWARVVDSDFHARYSATSRHYRYRILNRMTRSSLARGRVTWCHRPLDAERMHRAGQLLIGEHDFSSFRAKGCQARSPVRNLWHLDVRRQGQLVTMDVKANAFLHHMVRNIAGVLMAIGRGDRPARWSLEVLHQRNRALGGVTAPPHGLCLVGVDYPEVHGIPAPQGVPP
jgi:tRNA pseudouridine38-40 synthase